MKKYVLSFLLCTLVLPVYTLRAQEDMETPTLSGQAQCFEMLKQDMEETGVFSAPLETLQNMNYSDLEADFSRKYKGLISFGDFEISEPNVETRVYSFGEQTGYIHPPLNPYPISQETELWDEPVKQYIVVEEYIKEPGVGSHFMDCGFIALTAEDLMSVTRENYFFDQERVTIRKAVDDGSYKSWYSQYQSFDFDGEPLAIWRRLFVYPKSTQNSYFNKYDVADAKLAREVDSYDVLEFYAEPFVLVTDLDENGFAVTKAYRADDEGNMSIEVTVPEAFEPIEREGINKMYANAGYYAAIEAQFPEFYNLLAFRGSLNYETFKEMITSQESLTEDEKELLAVLGDYKGATQRYVDKLLLERDGVEIDDPYFDEKLADMADGDAALTSEQEEGNNEEANQPREDRDGSSTLLYVLLGIILCIIVIVVIVLFLQKKKNGTEHTENNVTNIEE